MHNNKYDYSLVEYKGTHTKVKIICIEHGIFEQVPNYHLSGSGCEQCGMNSYSEKRSYSFEQFVEKARLRYGDTYEYDEESYTSFRRKVKIICHTHGEFFQIASNHVVGSGCPKCTRHKIIEAQKLNTEQFIIRSNKIHKTKYDYSLSEYVDARSKVKIICNIHGVFEQLAGNHMYGQECPKCNCSKGEKIIRNFLIDNNIIFEEQKTFNGCKNKQHLRFDFYLPEYNYCIEFDGMQHYIPASFKKNATENDKVENLKVVQYNDNIKNEFCKNNNINLLRIPYWKKKQICKILTSYFL